MQKISESSKNHAVSKHPVPLMEKSIFPVSSSFSKRILTATIIGMSVIGTGCDKKETAKDNSSKNDQAVTEQTQKTVIELPRAKGTPIQITQTMGNDPINHLIHMQHEWKRQSLDALKGFAKSDAHVPEVTQFIEKNAFYTIPNGSRMTQRIESDAKEIEKQIKNPHSFEIVYMPEEFASQMPAPAYANDRTIRIATTFQTKEWLALILAHEAKHVRDKVIDHENSNNPDEYFAGEVNAHLMEMNMLKYWNQDAYKVLIEKGIPMYKNLDKQGLVDLALKLYPLGEGQASIGETNLGLASCIVAIAFEDAKREGKTDKDLQETYKTVGKFLGN